MASAHLLVLAIVLHVNFVAEAAKSTAKPGCQQKCGRVEIPYPFGIGNSSCFYDEWFEVLCSSTKPILKKLDVEVTQIDLPYYGKQTGWFSFNNPIMVSSGCASAAGKATIDSPLDLTGSPFYISASYNTFAASGCTSQAWMLDGKGKQVPNTGCASTCAADTNIGDCCTTALPVGLRLFNVSFSSTSGTADDGVCRYAMIAATKEWFYGHPGTSCSSTVRDVDSIPAWIEWGLPISSPEAVALERQSKEENSTIGIKNYKYDSDGYEYQYAFCDDGFEGSAYVTDGCEDIDECTTTPGICTNGTCANTYGFYKCIPGRTKAQIAIIVVCPVVGVLVVILGIWLGFKLAKRLQERKYFIQNGGLLLAGDEDGGRVNTYKAHELRKATNNFSKKNLLGKGGQGSVYKGTLKGGTAVAIKQCNKIERKKKEPKEYKRGADKSREAGDEPAGPFITEVNLLSKTLHKNIVKLLGCCLETKLPMLVYEHVINKDLAHRLQEDKTNNTDGFTLSWGDRLRIAVETAEGLSYLHRQAGIGIYHRDVKTDNILLDHKYIAKLADFGISQSVAPNQSQSDKASGGSAGYIDPEYSSTGQYTDKSDVYSFGVVLAELLTGRRPLSSYDSGGEDVPFILADQFKELKTAQIMGTLLDARVKQGKGSEVEAVIEVAKRCLEREGRNRPKMKEVVIELEKIRSKQTEVYAEEREEHDYEESAEISASPQITHPLRRQGSQSSDVDT